MMRINKKLISFEGNIATGKTTFEKMVEQRMLVDKDFIDCGAEFIEEPVKVWSSIRNDKGEGLLQVFYNDMNRWSYTFQNAAYITRMSELVKKILRSNKEYIFTDRSLQCDRKVFAKMLYDQEKLDTLEWNTYNKWNSFYDDIFYGGKYNVIYMRSEPEISHKRMLKRNRPAEKNTPLSYLQSVHQYHDEWLVNNCNTDKYNVLVLDCNEDFEDNINKFNELYDNLKKFILSIEPYDFCSYFFRDTD